MLCKRAWPTLVIVHFLVSFSPLRISERVKPTSSAVEPTGTAVEPTGTAVAALAHLGLYLLGCSIQGKMLPLKVADCNSDLRCFLSLDYSRAIYFQHPKYNTNNARYAKNARYANSSSTTRASIFVCRSRRL